MPQRYLNKGEMKKIFNFLLAMFPILSGYGFSVSLDFGSLLLFVAGVVCFIAYPKSFKIKFPEGFLVFLCVVLILEMFWIRSIPLRILLFSVNLCFACSFAKWEYVWKYYRALVLFCSLFFLLQESLFYTIGYRPSGLLPFVPTIYGESISKAMIESAIVGGRAASFFLEPSYFAQFLIPFVAINLFDSTKKGQKEAIIASVVVVLIRSGIGIMLLGVIYLLWYLFSSAKLANKILTSIVAIALLGFFVYFDSVFLRYFSGRFGELLSYTGDEEFQSSGFIRFFRGYYAFADVPIMNQLLGSPPEEVEIILSKNVFFLSLSDHFVNGMQMLLFYQGIVGAFFYIRHILLFPVKANNRALLVLTISFIFLLLGESYYLCSRAFLMTVFMYLLKKKSTIINYY